MKILKAIFQRPGRESLLDNQENETVIRFNYFLRHVHPSWSENESTVRSVVLGMCQGEYELFTLDVKAMKPSEVVEYMENNVWH